MDKNLTTLVNRLNRLFPDIKFYNEGHYENDDYCPPVDVDWFYIIKTLNKNGLEIKNIKE